MASVNRWTQWARQFRQRHARREARGAAGRMVLSLGAAPLTQIFVAGRTTLVHVHARLGVTRVPVPHTVLQCSRHEHAATRIGASTRIVTRHTAPSGSPRAMPSPQLAIPPAAEISFAAAPASFALASKFVEPSRGWTVRGTPSQRLTAIHELVRRWSNAAQPLIAPYALPAPLRHRAVRQELAAAGEPARLVFGRAPAHAEAAAVRPAEAAPAYEPQVRLDAAALAAAAPQINVEALTSQVIQQIDRRLIAYRERMGRG